jgi:hypothetical protein
MATPGTYAIEISTMQGVRVGNIRKEGPFGMALTREALGTGVFMLRIRNQAGFELSEKISML